MQQPSQMMAMGPSYQQQQQQQQHASITTEQIQQFLDENKKLILAILDNQNLGKLSECAQYQAKLQKNLMYLAAIADAQPPQQNAPPQMSPHPAMQQGGFYMQQHPMGMTQSPGGMFPQRMPMQFNNPHPHQQQDPAQLLQQQQAFQMQMQMGMGMGMGMGMRPMVGPNNGMHQIHADATLGGSSSTGPTPTAGLNDVRGGNNEGGTSGGDDGESSHLKGSDEGI